MDELHKNFPAIESVSSFGTDCAILLAISIFLKIVHIIIATQKANATDTIFPKGSVAEKSKGFF